MGEEHYAYDDNLSTISSIDFAIWSNNDVSKASVFGKDSEGVVGTELYESHEPKRGGLIDLRMGPTNESRDCDTCGLNNISCVGHFGHITLANYVFHMGYLTYVKKILGCICIRCSKLLIYKNENEIMDMLRNKSGRARLNEIRNLVKNVTYCQKANYGCGAPVSKIKLEIKKSTGAITLYSETNLTNIPEEGGTGFEGKKKNREILMPNLVYEMLKGISDQDCLIMGIDPTKSRPEDMILKILPVPPVAVRPSVRADFMASSMMEDDLTHKLADIIKANDRITHHGDSDTAQRINQDNLHLLQYQIASYLDSDMNIPKSEQKGKVTKSLGPRLKGKDGRVRSNLMGKRVDYSARTVITSDPTIEINQLGVPVKIAMNLTFPEIVTPSNIEFLSRLVRNGRYKYPGANFVFQASALKRGSRILPLDLRFKKDKIELKYGDIVERHLMDDDIVLLNRQPTLHKQSMMGHRVKVINNLSLSTFRLSVAVTTPYNADFDGDEMNIFLPQSIQTQIELEEIADVKRQIITPSTSRTIIGIVQDGLIGSYNLTSPSMRISWKDAMNMISYTSIDNFSAFKKGKEYTGHELFSMIIPPKINVDRGSEEEKNKLIIKNGILEKGYMTKDLLGSKKKNNLTQLIWDEYGIEETKDFLNNTQRLVNNFNLYNGFTVGVGDTSISKDVENQIQRLFESKDLKIKYLVTELENNPDLMDTDLFERTMFAELNVIREDVSKLMMSNISPTNNMGIMISSGSKGDAINFGQMGGCVGLQAFEGNLMPKKVNGRPIPYFYRDEESSESRGLIKNPFIKGVTFPDFFFLSMAGREGLIDQAIKSVVGETDIIIIADGILKNVKIGDWIDHILDDINNQHIIEYHQDRNMELMRLNNEVYIPTCDYKGNVSWGKISAITRHDPGNELYKIRTKSGREVIVTESKSVLIWNDNMEIFEMMSLSNVRKGNYVPVTKMLQDPNNYLDVTKNRLDKIIMGDIKNKIIKNKIIVENEKINELILRLNMSGIFANIVSDGIIIDSENIKTSNDVVLDEITEITKVDVSNYKKVYDLTIPSTLNFGLANGLHVVDTAESGYIQRKLIKLLEDYMVKYDGTVRSSLNEIIQFIYGDSGADTTRQYEYKMKLLDMSNTDILSKHIFTESEIRELKYNVNDLKSMTGEEMYVQSDNKEKMKEGLMYKELTELRDNLRISQIKTRMNWITMSDIYMLPINLQRIISNVKNNDILKNDKNKLTPSYVFEKIEDIMDCRNTMLLTMSESDKINKDSVKYKDDRTAKTALLASLYDSLSPKKAILEHKLNKVQMEQIATEIINSFNKNMAEPGEMVGIIAAQACGEPTTQLSSVYESHVIIFNKTKQTFYSGPMGQFADELIKNNKHINVELEPPNAYGLASSALIPSEEYYIISVSKHGKINWKRISEVSRHPANGKLIRIKTQSGKETTATLSHSFLKMENYEIKPIKGSDLKIGNRIPVAKYIPIIENGLTKIILHEMTIELDKEFGWFCGAYLANGYLNNNVIEINKSDEFDSIICNLGKKLQFDITKKNITIANKSIVNFLIDNFGFESFESNEKYIGGFIHGTNIEFIKGIISGYFDCNGYIQSNSDYQTIYQTIKVQSFNSKLINDMCILINYVGIFAVIEKDSKEQNGQIRDTQSEFLYTIYIPVKYSQKFKDEIGLKINKQAKKLNNIINYINENNSGFDDIDMIEDLEQLISDISGKLMPNNQLKSYKQITNNKAISRETLGNIINEFKTMINTKLIFSENLQNINLQNINSELNILEDLYKSDIIWDKIIELEILDDNHRYVYDFSVPELESFMVDTGILVHNTLNSIDWGEEIIIHDKLANQFNKYKIGEYIDDLIKNPDTRYIGDIKDNEMGDTYYLDIKKLKHYIESIDEDGNIIWEHIEAVTKHLPINKDGTNTLLKVVTKSGRSVIATKAKSFLTKFNGKIIPIRGDELTLETKLPIKDNSGKLYMDQIESITEIQPMNKYVYDLTVANTKNFALANGLMQRDSFHHSGIAVMATTTQGVPRIKELLSLTKNLKTPQMIIYPVKKYMSSRDMANKIASYIEYTTIGKLRNKLEVYYDPKPYKKDGFIEKDKANKIFNSSTTSKNSCQGDVISLPWLLRIELNREKMLEKEITLVEIKSKLCHLWEKRHDKTVKKEEKVIFDNITQIILLSNTDYDQIPILHLRFDMITFDFTILNSFIDLMIDNFKLKGIPNITGIGAISEERILEFDNDDRKIEKNKQYVIYTMGSNLRDIRYLNNIDLNKTICNDVVSMYETFGIEAARSTLIREIIYAYERAGSSVNYQHVNILVDLMTFNGNLTSIDRHGMSKTDAGPLSRASFEKTVDIMLTAATFGEVDNMNAVSSRIMAGLPVKGGTGYCNVLLDTDMIQNSEYVEESKYDRSYIELTKNTVIKEVQQSNEINSEEIKENKIFIPTF